MQAQAYPAAKWAIALRMSDRATDAQIERAFNEGRILRTHVMRPTWHFVSATDLHWMLELTAARVHRALAYGYRQFELDVATRMRAASVFETALGDRQCLTRAELGAHLARAGLAAKGVRLALLTIHAELERVICSGPRRGTQATYALLASGTAKAVHLQRDEALAELSMRYFRSHGPATVRDFVWWSGLTHCYRCETRTRDQPSPAPDHRRSYILDAPPDACPSTRFEAGAPAADLRRVSCRIPRSGSSAAPERTVRDTAAGGYCERPDCRHMEVRACSRGGANRCDGAEGAESVGEAVIDGTRTTVRAIPERYGRVRWSTSTIIKAAISRIAPTSRHTSTRAPRCCSRLVNQWPMPHTATTLQSPREL